MDRKWWTLIAVCVGAFMLLLDITIVNVALPEIEQTFNASLSELQWVIDAYALTLAALELTAGSTADLYGRRRLFAIGIVTFVVGSVLCGSAESATMLALSRGFQGIGGAIMFATALALLAQAFPPNERHIAFGAFGAVTGVAIAVGPLLGGALTSGLSWRWIFFVNVPVGILALLVTLLRVDESKLPGAPRPDIAGFLTFSVSLGALVYALIESHRDGWASQTVTVSLAVSAVAMAAFLVIQLRKREPMFDMSLLRVKTFNGGLVAAWAISASIFSLVTYLVIYMQGFLGYSAIETGIRFLPFTVALFLAAAAAGRLTARVRARDLIAAGFLLLAVGMFLMRGLSPSDGWTHFLPGFIVAGVGAGLINVPLSYVAVGVVAPERAGMASGANSTSRQVGIATGVAALGSILAAEVRTHVESGLAGTPLAGHSDELGAAVSSGSLSAVAAEVPAQYHEALFSAARASYVDGLNLVLAIGAIVAAVAVLLTLVLIRQKDFVDAPSPAEGATPEIAAAESLEGESVP